MTPFEILSLSLSLVALLVALAAFQRAGAAQIARAQVEAFLRNAQETDIQVLFLKMDAGHYNFTLANRGASAARNIELELVDTPPPGADPLATTREQLPVRQLDPGGYVQLPAQVSEATPHNFELCVRWVNAGGLQTEKTVAVNLLD